jgi:hypothetical protein
VRVRDTASAELIVDFPVGGDGVGVRFPEVVRPVGVVLGLRLGLLAVLVAAILGRRSDLLANTNRGGAGVEGGRFAIADMIKWRCL